MNAEAIAARHERLRLMRRKYGRVHFVRKQHIRFFVLKRDGFRCTACGDDQEHHLQACHMIAERRGGLYSLGNLITKCPVCHGQEHGRAFIGSARTREVIYAEA